MEKDITNQLNMEEGQDIIDKLFSSYYKTLEQFPEETGTVGEQLNQIGLNDSIKENFGNYEVNGKNASAGFKIENPNSEYNGTEVVQIYDKKKEEFQYFKRLPNEKFDLIRNSKEIINYVREMLDE